MKKLVMMAVAVVAGLVASADGNQFRVTPYVQHPTTNAMSVLWFSEQTGDATLKWWRADADEATASSVVVSGVEAPALNKTTDGTTTVAQYKYAHRITGLVPDTVYNYKVTLAGEGGATYAKSFRTSPAGFRPIRFVAYSDSETQGPQKFGHWENPAFDHDNGKTAESDPRRYFVDKVEGFASNICAMVSREPDFIVAAGDLAGTGSQQPDWDRYWDHNAGKFDDPAGGLPLLTAPGNHDYYQYGISGEFGEMGIGKYLTYFEVEPNTAAVDADQKCRFHRVDYGPVALIFIDPNNGPNRDPANTYDKWAQEYATPNLRDTNQCLTEDVCRAPDFNPGSPQYQWIEEQLADAQTNKLFTFLVCHQCPYSIGYHGRPNGDKGIIGGDGEYLSGVATRCMTNLVFKYGVDGWICGHDEICEHSRLTGTEQLAGGGTASTEIHVYDVGYGGDDLRGARRTSEPNPYEVFRAHTDAPEVYENGLLVSGGKHYGHLEVNVTTNEVGQWICKLQQNYVFVSTNALGQKSFDLRTYPDVVVLTNTVYAPPQPEPTGVARIGDTTYESLDAAFKAAVAGDKVEMMVDVALAETLTIDASKAATFDLAGHTLSLADGYSAAMMIDVSGTTMIITNGTVNTGAKQVNLRDNSVITVAANTLFQMNGTYTFRVNVATLNVYGEFINTASDVPAIQLYKPGAVANVYEGAHICAKGDAIRVNFNDGAAYLNIYGGFVESNGGYPAMYAYKSGNTSVITVTGGTFKTTGGDNPETQGMFNIQVDSVVVTPLTDACKAKFSTNVCGWHGGGDSPKYKTLAECCAAGYEPVKGEDGYYTIQAKQSKPEPYTPIVVDDPEAKAQEINAGGAAAKKLVMAPPDGATVTDTYYGYFSAVPGAGQVTMELNTDGTNAVSAAVKAADVAALDAVLGTTEATATLAVSSPLAGFYYSLRQNAKLTSLDYSDKNKLGGKDEIMFTLDKSKSSGFYQMIVTPKAVE